MCNDYEQHLDWAQFSRALEEAALGPPADQELNALPMSDDIRVGDSAPIVIAESNIVRLRDAVWGFPQAGRRPPVFNFRSENRNFAKSQRCIVPASAFFEFTGKSYPKTKWRFALANGGALGVAGLLRDYDGKSCFTMLTTAPGEDVAPFHSRQIVVLTPDEWGKWLYLSRSEAEVLRPLPQGSLVATLDRKGAEPPDVRLT